MITADERSKVETSVITLGNAAEVISRVLLNVAGNDISTKLNGENMTMASIKDLAFARFNFNLSRKVK